MPPDAEALEEIERFVEDQRDARRVPGFAFAVVDGAEIVYAGGFGTADGSTAPVTGRTPFVLGSTSKSFTALAVMQLVDAGTVSLSDPVARLVPELRLADGAERRITVRQLLNQTSGLPAVAGGRLLRSVGDGSAAEVVAELDGTGLSAEPGAAFGYSNANYVLLGLVIERASGLSYGEYVQRRIFDPLGMRDSYVSPEAAKRAGLAVGHRYWFGFPIAHGPTSPDRIRSAGYLMSSAADMARYLSVWLNGGVFNGRRLVSVDGMRMLLRPGAEATLGAWAGHQTSRYAMGWFVGGPWREPAILHPGGAPDSSSLIVLLPERRQAVVALANANLELPLPVADGATDRIASGVVSLLVGEEPQTGSSLGWFYVVFDALAGLTLVVIALAAFRLLRRRGRPVGFGRRVARIGQGALETVVAALLLAAPVLTGQGYAGAMLWMPDLALTVLVAGGLLGLVGITRVALAIRAPRGATDQAVVDAQAVPAPAGHRGPRRRLPRPQTPSARRAPRFGRDRHPTARS